MVMRLNGGPVAGLVKALLCGAQSMQSIDIHSFPFVVIHKDERNANERHFSAVPFISESLVAELNQQSGEGKAGLGGLVDAECLKCFVPEKSVGYDDGLERWEFELVVEEGSEPCRGWVFAPMAIACKEKTPEGDMLKVHHSSLTEICWTLICLCILV